MQTGTPRNTAQPRKTCRRLNIPGHAHELTFSCYRRQALLSNDQARGFLAQAIKTAREKHRFRVLAYVFMPEHVHAIVWPAKNDYSISAVLKSIKQPASRRVIGQMRRDDAPALARLATGEKARPYRFWQAGGGYDRDIVGLDYLEKAIAYIHANPVRRGLVENPDEWYWSSAQDWEGTGVGPVPVDTDVLALTFRNEKG